jgi:uncharacterized membrane protein YccC
MLPPVFPCLDCRDHPSLAFDRLERTQEAQNAYTRSLELQPNYASDRKNWGWIRENTGYLEQTLATDERGDNFELENEIAPSHLEIIQNTLR